MSKRPGDAGGAPEGKRVYAGGRQEFMDSEPMLPEEYEDPDDEDVYMDDVLDQKVRESFEGENKQLQKKPGSLSPFSRGRELGGTARGGMSAAGVLSSDAHARVACTHTRVRSNLMENSLATS